MRLIPIDDVVIGPSRQRTAGKATKDISELKKSILQRGLIHAPMLHTDNTLIAGERRLLAIKELYLDGLQFNHDGQVIPLGMLPYTTLAEADEATLLELEFDENFHRLDLTWQERAKATVRIHELRKEVNPAQTLKDTAALLLTATAAPDAPPPTPQAIQNKKVNLVKLKAVVDNLANPIVANAANPEKAYKELLDARKRELERDLIHLSPSVSPHTLILGDFRTLSDTLERESFDLILTDPPYGINAHKAGAGALEHRYDDTPTYALDLYRHIFRSAFGLLKPMGTVFVFCDIEHFITLRTMAEQQAFSTFRTPLVWHKGSEGHAPWGREGPKRTYELLLYAVKGQRSLALPLGSDVLSVPRNTVDPNRVHAAEKPAELLRFLISKACRSGDRVLDPCCGSGPIFTAAQGLGVHVTGVEMNPEYHTLSASRLARLASGQETAPSLDGVKNVTHQPTISELIAGLTPAPGA